MANLVGPMVDPADPVVAQAAPVGLEMGLAVRAARAADHAAPAGARCSGTTSIIFPFLGQTFGIGALDDSVRRTSSRDQYHAGG